MKRRRKGRVLMALGMLCVVSAMVMALHSIVMERRSDKAAQDVLVQLSQEIPSDASELVEDTPILIIADQTGAEIGWPLQESGMPMPWPVNQDGKPESSITDATGTTYIWHMESNRPRKVLQSESETENLTSVQVTNAILAIPMPTATETIYASFTTQNTTDVQTGQELHADVGTTAILATRTPAAVTPVLSTQMCADVVTDALREEMPVASPSMISISASMIEKLEAADSIRGGEDQPIGEPAQDGGQTSDTADVGIAEWTVDSSGSLLPYVSDGKGQVIPWLTDAQGNVMTLDVLNRIWEFLLKQLYANWQELFAKPAFVRNPDMEMPVTTLDGHEYIGILNIPSQEITLPIMSEWSYAKLSIAPCRYRGSVYSGDIILAGHSSNGHFLSIKKLIIGDEVRFTDVDGNVFIYSVIKIEVIGENDVGAMLAGADEWDLSMFTCSHNSRKRTTIRCKLISHIAMKDR